MKRNLIVLLLTCSLTLTSVVSASENILTESGEFSSETFGEEVKDTEPAEDTEEVKAEMLENVLETEGASDETILDQTEQKTNDFPLERENSEKESKENKEPKDTSFTQKEIIKAVEDVEHKSVAHGAASTVTGCTTWSQIKSAVENGATRIRIDGDINANSTITIPSGKTVAIFPQSSGNYSITRSTTFVGGSLFSVKGTLTIEASSAVNASTGAKTLLSIRGRQSTMYAGAPLLTVDGGTLNLTAGYLGWNKFLKNPDNPDVLSGDGGCIRVNSGTFYMTGGVIEQSAALNGGGVSVQSGASFFMTGGQIVGNRTAQSTKEQNDTTGNGGGVVVYGNFVMTGGTIGGDFTSGGNVFSGNTADFAGGIGIISGNVTISGGTLSKNASTKHGGAVHLYGAKSTETGRLNVVGGTITENTAPRGGGIFLSTRGILNIGTVSTAPTISRNVSTTTTNEFGGGGIYASSNASGFVIENGVFDGNTAAMHGGAVATQTTTSISGGQFVRNSAKSGGAVRSSGNLWVSGGLFGGGRDTDGNTAGDSGAAISQSGGNTMTFSGGTISHNSGGIGALFVASNGKLDMRGGEIHSNTNTSGIAVNSNASSSGTAVISGGNIYGNAAAGVWNSGSVTLSGTTVVRNNATYGILNNGSGTLCMERGSIYGNGNAAQATGGGIYNGGTAVFTGGAVYGNAGYGLTNAGTCQVNGNFMVGIYSYSGEGNYSASANYSGCVKNSGTLTAGGLLAYAANAPCLENTGNATFTSANGTNRFFSYKTPAVVKNAGRLYIGAKSAGASFADTLVLCAEDAESGIENTGTLVCGGLYVAGEYTVTGTGSHADNGYHIKTGICNTGTGRYDTGSFAQTVSLCDYAEIKNCLENGIDNKAGTVKIWGNAKIHNGKGMGIKNAGTVTMTGGTIAENNTGVYNSGVFDLTGGNITKNEKGVHQGGTFYMSKAAVVAEDNEVFLAKDKVITVKDALSTNGLVARIVLLNEKGREVEKISGEGQKNEENGDIGRIVAEAAYGTKKGSDALYYDKDGACRFALSNGGILRAGDGMDKDALEEKKQNISDKDIVVSNVYTVSYQADPDPTEAEKKLGYGIANFPEEQKKYWCENIWLPNGTLHAQKPYFPTEPHASTYLFAGWKGKVAETGNVLEFSDVYLYKENHSIIICAQWESNCDIAYLGGEQDAGEDILDCGEENKGISKAGTYTLYDNQEENGEAHFKKSKEKEAFVNEDTGETVKQKVTATAAKWKFAGSEKSNGSYSLGDIAEMNDLYSRAQKANAVTKGAPCASFGDYPKGDAAAFMSETVTKGAGQPAESGRDCINLELVWDYGPTIEAYDLYYTLTEAQGGYITEDELLSKAHAYDEEEKRGGNEKGELKRGIDNARKTTFDVWDYSPEDFTTFTGSGSVTETYRAIDSVGNETRYRVTVYIVDTTARDVEKGKVRFISKKHLNTLDADSVWRVNPEYNTQLQAVLNNRKKNTETYTSTALGTNVTFEKPGSGTWETEPEQVWQFSHEDVLAVQEWIEAHGVGNIREENALSNFLKKFAANRIK